METNETLGAISRRRIMVAGAGTALGASVLAACGGDDDDDPKATDSPSGSATEGSLGKVSDVPVGGAFSATDADGKPVILAQPTEGTVVAFSAICTHNGCTVAPDGDILKCPCHGSTYDLAGKNTGGPAPSPLTEITVKVEGGEVVAG